MRCGVITKSCYCAKSRYDIMQERCLSTSDRCGLSLLPTETLRFEVTCWVGGGGGADKFLTSLRGVGGKIYIP